MTRPHVLTTDEMMSLLDAPIELPAGIRAVTHYCPQLMSDGFTEQDATFVIELAREGTFFVARCSACGVQVRSRAVSS